ncbi:MAG TPA: Tad domain-containing protein [Anaerohalosphaeraceae bacterium]|nr:Tad domain-containing protein [Anaerohalosphaeraceae bacterium]
MNSSVFADMKKSNLSKLLNDKGVTAIIVALVLTVLIGIAALAIDIGYLTVAKNEAQNAADASALAGARQMAENYGSSNVDLTLNVENVAQNIGGANRVDKKNLFSDNMVIQIGKWYPSNSTFITPANVPDAVCVEVKREPGLTSGPISTFLAPVIGKYNYNINAKSCAYLTGPCEGKPTIPLGISLDWFDNHVCNAPDIIELNATTSSCAGWTNLSSDPFKSLDVQCMINCTVCSDSAICPSGSTDTRCTEACSSCSSSPCKNRPKTTPEVEQNDPIEFGGGSVTDIYRALQRLWSLKCTIGADGICRWETFVVVYDDGDPNAYCGNPNKEYVISTFASLVLTNVIPTGTNMGVYGTVACRSTDEPGGCENAGTVNKSPHLVK